MLLLRLLLIFSLILPHSIHVVATNHRYPHHRYLCRGNNDDGVGDPRPPLGERNGCSNRE